MRSRSAPHVPPLGFRVNTLPGRGRARQDKAGPGRTGQGGHSQPSGRPPPCRGTALPRLPLRGRAAPAAAFYRPPAARMRGRHATPPPRIGHAPLG